MHIRQAAAIVASAFLLSSCASDSAPDTSATGERMPASPSGVDSVGSAPAEIKSATEVAEAIKTAVPEVTRLVTVDEDNDPNNLVGRPGGYIDGAILFDPRAEAYDDQLGVDQGAFLEVWPDAEAATGRAKYIQDTLQQVRGLGTEYHYQHEGYLLRVNGRIKPSQALAYEEAFRAQF